MNRHDLESLGEQLRSIGHRRHELAGKVFDSLEQGSHSESQTLHRQLTDVTGQAISLMQRQLDSLGDALVTSGRARPEHVERSIAAAHMGQVEEAQEMVVQLTDITGQGTDPVPRPRSNE